MKKTEAEYGAFKTALKKLWDFQLKYSRKSYVENIEAFPGVMVSVDMWVYIEGGHVLMDTYLYKSVEIVDKNLKKFINEVCPHVLERWVEDIYNPNDSMIDDLDATYTDMVGELEELFENICDEIEVDELTATYNTFTDAYSECLIYYKDALNLAKVATKTVNLTSEYDAIISAGDEYVKVGCKNVPIEQIRKVVAEYDALRTIK